MKAVDGASDLEFDQTGVAGGNLLGVVDITDRSGTRSFGSLRSCRVYVIFESGKRVW